MPRSTALSMAVQSPLYAGELASVAEIKVMATKQSDHAVPMREDVVDQQNLEEINNHLKTSGTPYLGGDRPNARDLDLGPKFYHIKTAMKHYKVHRDHTGYLPLHCFALTLALEPDQWHQDP